MSIVYIDPESRNVQGKYPDIVKRYGKTWHIQPLGGGNGNWLLTRKSDVLVNGVSYRDFVLNHYNKSRLTRALFERFCDDVENGRV